MRACRTAMQAGAESCATPAGGLAGVHELPKLRALLGRRRGALADALELRHARALRVHVQRALLQLKSPCSSTSLILLNIAIGNGNVTCKTKTCQIQ